jgi:hypothetical protein
MHTRHRQTIAGFTSRRRLGPDRQTTRDAAGPPKGAGLASGVQVQNISGAGGTIGLAQFSQPSLLTCSNRAVE